MAIPGVHEWIGDEQGADVEEASYQAGYAFALGEVKRFVVDGDGANWIREGVRYFPNAIFQPDGFHLRRARHELDDTRREPHGQGDTAMPQQGVVRAL